MNVEFQCGAKVSGKQCKNILYLQAIGKPFVLNGASLCETGERSILQNV